MRDRKAYQDAGRNDPLSADQLREHPYDFVSLPVQPARHSGQPHHQYSKDLLTGRLRLTYNVVTPLHVGSGVFERARDCGLGEGNDPVRGIARTAGRPVLPASGWKGAVRARFEALTRSRLALFDQRQREPAFKVPEELRSVRGSHSVKLEDRRLGKLRPLPRFESLRDLPPAEALFGCMGYRGRVHPADGHIEGTAANEPLQVTPLESPCMHRLAKPGAIRSNGPGKLEISEVEGRKFYYDGPIVHSREGDEVRGARFERIDFVPPGAVVTLEVQVENLNQEELGALLIAAGFGGAVGILRFGGFKPAGLGKVELSQTEVLLDRGRSGLRRRLEPYDPAEAIAGARRGLVDLGALAELDEITRRRRSE